jgi:hypothetical protein
LGRSQIDGWVSICECAEELIQRFLAGVSSVMVSFGAPRLAWDKAEDGEIALQYVQYCTVE